jgi:hypothetical protein
MDPQSRVFLGVFSRSYLAIRSRKGALSRPERPNAQHERAANYKMTPFGAENKQSVCQSLYQLTSMFSLSYINDLENLAVYILFCE